MKDPKYTVHLESNGSAGYAHDCVAVDTLQEAKDALVDFAGGVGAYTQRGEEAGAWADVLTYDERDTPNATHGDPELRRVARYELNSAGNARKAV